MHMHQPSELTQRIFAYIFDLFEAQSIQTAQETYLTVFRAIYLTLKYTKIHNQNITENNKIITVIQLILSELQTFSNEKLKLLALKTLRELAANGYHMVLLDMSLLSTLMRYI